MICTSILTQIVLYFCHSVVSQITFKGREIVENRTQGGALSKNIVKNRAICCIFGAIVIKSR
jgi:hypothetical protein